MNNDDFFFVEIRLVDYKGAKIRKYLLKIFSLGLGFTWRRLKIKENYFSKTRVIPHQFLYSG